VILYTWGLTSLEVDVTCRGRPRQHYDRPVRIWGTKRTTSPGIGLRLTWPLLWQLLVINYWIQLSIISCFNAAFATTTRAVLCRENRAMPLQISIAYVSNFTTASCGFSATPRLSCTGLHQRRFKCWNYTQYADFHLPWFWTCVVIFGYHRDFASRPWKSAYCVCV